MRFDVFNRKACSVFILKGFYLSEFLAKFTKKMKNLREILKIIFCLFCAFVVLKDVYSSGKDAFQIKNG